MLLDSSSCSTSSHHDNPSQALIMTIHRLKASWCNAAALHTTALTVGLVQQRRSHDSGGCIDLLPLWQEIAKCGNLHTKSCLSPKLHSKFDCNSKPCVELSSHHDRESHMRSQWQNWWAMPHATTINFEIRCGVIVLSTFHVIIHSTNTENCRLLCSKKIIHSFIHSSQVQWLLHARLILSIHIIHILQRFQASKWIGRYMSDRCHVDSTVFMAQEITFTSQYIWVVMWEQHFWCCYGWRAHLHLMCLLFRCYCGWPFILAVTARILDDKSIARPRELAQVSIASACCVWLE